MGRKKGVDHSGGGGGGVVVLQNKFMLPHALLMCQEMFGKQA